MQNTDKPDPLDREFTDADFNKATRAKDHPLLAKAVRGPQAAPTKVPVSIRLSPEVVEHFKSGGTGWQTRIDDVLREHIRKTG